MNWSKRTAGENDKYRQFHSIPNCQCAVCGVKMYMKPYRQRRAKHGVTCSKACSNLLKSQYSQGKGNHQYGLKGRLNASFRGEEISDKNHNLTEIMVYAPTHPRANHNGRVRKHVIVVEENYTLFDTKYFEQIEGSIISKRVLMYII